MLLNMKLAIGTDNARINVLLCLVFYHTEIVLLNSIISKRKKKI